MKKFLSDYNLLVRVGLGLIFIANALTAIFAPSEFVEIIKDTFILNFLHLSPEIFVKFIIGLNDSIVGLLLIFGFATRRVAVWAAIWLVGVMFMIGEPIDIVEHAGFFLIAIALALGDKYISKQS